MIKNEWIKVISNRIFWIFLVLLLVVNGIGLYWSLVISHQNTDVTGAEYQILYKSLEPYSDEEKLDIVTQKLEDAEEKIEEALQEETVPSDIFSYSVNRDFYEEIQKELLEVIGYREKIETLLTSAEKQMDSNQSAQKVEQAYRDHAGISVCYVPMRGIGSYVDNPITDICILCGALFAVFFIVVAERQKQLSILSKTTIHGRKVHGCVKLVTLGMVTLIVAVLLHAQSFFLISRIYPMGNLHTSIQSIYPLCYLKISVEQFLLLYFAGKVLRYLFAVICFFLICVIFRRTMSILITLTLMGAAIGMIYMDIVPTSYLGIFYQMNPITISQIGRSLSRLQFINLFGYPVDQNVVYLGAIVIFGVIIAASSLKLYQVQEEKDSQVQWGIRWESRSLRHTHMFFHEGYKVLWAQRVGLLIVLAGMISALTYNPVSGKTYDIVEFLYNRYSDGLEGKFDESIAAQIDQMYGDMEEKSFQDMDNLHRYDYALQALEQMQEYSTYLEGKEESYYLNNKGFLILTGGDEQSEKRQLAVFMMMMALALVIFNLTVAIDYQNGEIAVVRATVGGQKYYWKYKHLIGFMILIVLAGIFWIPEAVNVWNTFGAENIHAPAYSLQHLAYVGKHISVLGYMVWRYLKGIFILIVGMELSYWLETRIRSSILAIIFSMVLMEIPLYIIFISLLD
jgi:hypothetical protein